MASADRGDPAPPGVLFGCASGSGNYSRVQDHVGAVVRGSGLALFAFAFLTGGALPAQTLSPDPAPARPTGACCLIPALTSVEIDIMEPLSSKTSTPGQMFAIRLAEPIRVNDRIIVPAGASGQGQVVHAAKARAAGKPGELILAARFLDANGVRIPLRSFRYGSATGRNNVDTAAIVGIAVASPLMLFIQGGQVNIPAGTRANAKVSADVSLPGPDSTQRGEEPQL